MHGHQPPFRGKAAAGGGRGRGPQQSLFPSPSQLPDLSIDPYLGIQDYNLYLQNIAYARLQSLTPQQNFYGQFPYQNPNFPFQNPSMPLPYQFPNNFDQQHNYSSTELQAPGTQQQSVEVTQQSQSSHPLKSQKLVRQNGKEVIDVVERSKQHLRLKDEQKEKQLREGVELQSQNTEKQQAQNSPLQNPKLVKYQRHFTKHLVQERQPLITRVDKAVEKAWRDLLSSGETVSSWKVSLAALVTLQADSWDSLGFRMQEVPSLRRLIFVEGKINAFIHCFVGVRRITSLYDLEVAICENEGIERFEELGLGPLLRHPLAVHYFLLHSDVTEVVKLTTEDIILSLHDYMNTNSNKDVIIDEFLDFLAKSNSSKGKENLGVRIQSLGMHISFIREARRSKHTTLRRCLNKMKEKYGDEILRESTKGSGIISQERPVFTPEKKILDERFSSMSQRLESFASVHKEFRGKHTRFDSSGPEDEENDDSTDEDNMKSNDDKKLLPLQNVHNFDRVSTCPYPSATEEISRLGLKGELESQSVGSGSTRTRRRLMKRKNKRKLEDASCTASAPAKLLKRITGRHSINAIGSGNSTELVNDMNGPEFSLSDNSIKRFIATWKETCKEHSLAEVLDRMTDFCEPGDSKKAVRYRKRMRKSTKQLFILDPWIGLLNVAVTAIKSDMFDSIYSSFDSIIQSELPSTLSEYESIDVEPSEKQTSFVSHAKLSQIHSVTGEEILGKISEYYNLDSMYRSSSRSPLEDKFISLKKLCSCELWLLDQFSLKEFKSLDHGEFFNFLEKHAPLLPTEIQKLFDVDIYAKPPLEVSVLQNLLMLLVSQAATNLWEDETITKHMISALILNQFPLLSFRIVENGSMDDFLKVLGEFNNTAASNCVLFSATLLGKKDAVDPLKEDQNIRTVSVETISSNKTTALKSITSKSAIEVLLRAPMLSDLNSWSHWDLIFAPSLGPLVGWLSSEANAKELLCLVTKDGKVIRINQYANADSFLEAALQISAFRTAVELLSLLSLAGGEKQVPLLLLKAYARQAFDVISKTHFENIEVQDKKNYISNELVVNAVDKKVFEPGKISTQTIQGVSASSRYILDCLGFLPSEFHGFVADILLSGMQSVIKDAPYVILCECNQKERIMLHEIGLSIGIVEWIDDYQKLCVSGFKDFFVPSVPAHFGAARPSLGAGSSYVQNSMDMYVCGNGVTTSCFEEDGRRDESTEINGANQDAVVCIDGIDNGIAAEYSENKKKDAALVIESIRKYEFGLDPNLSCSESTMLEKQHARLGRALHCLSQELYSEDSHFLLELVQNADDNIYPESVEPTLTFILQESSIVVLNNERGFSEQNIRALCDVGNSTKKGSGTGYIGQKGIGFKSVFRVTDAPEIHSNGFHIKFDISGGQIGFVLPTVVAPCNIELYNRLILQESGQMNRNTWNTCILLPFRSKLSEETAMKMFSDLHASLLLFLHRLQCIMFRNMLNDSFLVMRKEILLDGIVKVSCGKYKMTWLVESQKLRAHTSRPKVQTTEIAIAFPLEESDNGDYSARLELQPVFAFLPLRTYGLKFILQGDFVLPSSRQEVDKNDPWNEWLLTKFPGLFVKAERSFCTLSCFRDNPGKAVSAYMNFVPLVGEVHDFFSGLPKVIALELRRTSCLLLEGDKYKMVPPCNVLRGWNEQARELLPHGFLQEHLGLGFLDRNIVLSDPLARALGIAEYGPEILIKFLTCLCRTKSGLESMGLVWLSSFLNALYMMLSQTSGLTDLIDSLKQIPFIPLSDGTYSAVDGGTIWLHSDSLNVGFGGKQELEAFPQLYTKLRIVNPAIFSTSDADRTLVDNTATMLQKIGAQQLSAHEIMKVHILPAMSSDEILTRDKDLLTDYLCFVMVHLQSSCPYCCFERDYTIRELRNKAYILTNFGYRRLADTSIHFSKEFGNPINVKKLIDNLDMKWYEVDVSYLKHPVNDSLSDGLIKWRSFLLEIGVTDFVQVVQIEKNISDLHHAVLKNMKWNAELISAGVVVKDWESHELVQILSLLCSTGDGERCKYLLEILDTLWDDNLSSKATGFCDSKSSIEGRTFKSTFLSSIHDVKWVVSSVDNKLHYPKDLFHDCDTVCSLLGGCAPYALPKVRSTKLISDIGFKTKVTLSDILEILRAWRDSNSPFKASIAQMSKLYSFIWGEMVDSKKQVSEALHSVPFIFVPNGSVKRHGDMVSGVFLSTEEVYWHDPTGSIDLIKEIHPQNSLTSVPQHPLVKTLCNVYPGLCDFFVKECGVREIPSCHGYFDILQQLSTVALPSQAAGNVFQVFLKWADGLTSGSLSSGEIITIKDCLMNVECAVLPTVLDRWVSLHPSFGSICWCNDKKLKKMCKEMDNIDFLYFGNLSDYEEDLLQSKVSVLLQNLGIPALSKIITREAIYYGPADSNVKASLIDWALPYAQRYIYSVHPDIYLRLKQSEFSIIKQLKVTVIEKLFYRNVLKSSGSASKKRYECNCLLQGNTLYATSASNSHALFLELSCLFFGGASNLHLANFLHMITTMVESGSTEDQIELFITNSQKMPKVPDEESTWSLSSISSLTGNNESLQTGVEREAIHKQMSSKSKKKAGIASTWPPADWKTAPGFEHGRLTYGFRSQAALSHPNSSVKDEENDVEDLKEENDASMQIDIDADWMIEDDMAGSTSLETEKLVNNYAPNSNQTLNAAPIELPSDCYDAERLPIISCPERRFSARERLQTGTPNVAEMLLTGRLGEKIAFKYLTRKFRGKIVKWVNEDNETGLPYDIVLENGEGRIEYFEVKATRSARKDWFNITKREWQFAAENQECYSIAHVILSSNSSARVTIFRNPVKQCQTGKLQLVIMMPKELDLNVS